MNTIRLEIKCGEKLRKAYTYHMPESVDELTGKHLKVIAEILDREADPLAQRMEMLIRLARITRPDLFTGAHVAEAMELLHFLDDKEFIMQHPKIKRVGLFIAPKSRMKNFTGGQMALCDTILQAIEATGGDDKKKFKRVPAKLLNHFCAANCTLAPFGWSNFVADYLAIPFFKYLVRRRTKLAMLMQYRAMRRIFPDRYPNAFNSDQTAERFPSLGWDGTIVRLSGEKFGHPGHVRKTPAHQLFTFLEQARRDDIRAESRNRKR